MRSSQPTAESGVRSAFPVETNPRAHPVLAFGAPSDHQRERLVGHCVHGQAVRRARLRNYCFAPRQARIVTQLGSTR
jgi:hypothetical protein